MSEILQQAIDQGLMNPDGTYTPDGQFYQMTEGMQDREMLRELYEDGFIDGSFTPTRKGRMLNATEEDAVRSGPQDYLVWKQIPENQNQSEKSFAEYFAGGILNLLPGRTTQDLASKAATGIASWALDAIPKAQKAGSLSLDQTPYLGDYKRFSEKYLPGGVARKNLEKMLFGKDELAGLSDEEKQAAAAAQLGETTREMLKNLAGTGPMLVALANEKNPLATDEERALSEWNLKSKLQQLDDLTPAQAAAVAVEFFPTVFHSLGLNKEEVGSAAAEHTRQVVERARSLLTPEQLEVLDARGGAAGELMDAAMLVPAGGALKRGLRAVTKAGKKTAKVAPFEARPLSDRSLPDNEMQGGLHTGRVPYTGKNVAQTSPGIWLAKQRATPPPLPKTTPQWKSQWKSPAWLPEKSGGTTAPAIGKAHVREKFLPPKWETKARMATEKMGPARRSQGAMWLLATGNALAAAFMHLLHPGSVSRLLMGTKRGKSWMKRKSHIAAFEKPNLQPSIETAAMVGPLLATSQLPRGNERVRLRNNVALFSEFAEDYQVDPSALALAFIISKRDPAKSIRQELEEIAEELKTAPREINSSPPVILPAPEPDTSLMPMPQSQPALIGQGGELTAVGEALRDSIARTLPIGEGGKKWHSGVIPPIRNIDARGNMSEVEMPPLKAERILRERKEKLTRLLEWLTTTKERG